MFACSSRSQGRLGGSKQLSRRVLRFFSARKVAAGAPPPGETPIRVADRTKTLRVLASLMPFAERAPAPVFWIAARETRVPPGRLVGVSGRKPAAFLPSTGIAA